MFSLILFSSCMYRPFLPAFYELKASWPQFLYSALMVEIIGLKLFEVYCVWKCLSFILIFEWWFWLLGFFPFWTFCVVSSLTILLRCIFECGLHPFVCHDEPAFASFPFMMLSFHLILWSFGMKSLRLKWSLPTSLYTLFFSCSSLWN